MYPRLPIKKKYISNTIKPVAFFGIPGLVSIISVFSFFTVTFSSWFIIAGAFLSLVILLLIIIVSDEIFVRRNIASKKNGPLLWKDNIEGYKTAHKTITKNDRIKKVVENRVLLFPE